MESMEWQCGGSTTRPVSWAFGGCFHRWYTFYWLDAVFTPGHHILNLTNPSFRTNINTSIFFLHFKAFDTQQHDSQYSIEADSSWIWK